MRASLTHIVTVTRTHTRDYDEMLFLGEEEEQSPLSLSLDTQLATRGDSFFNRLWDAFGSVKNLRDSFISSFFHLLILYRINFETFCPPNNPVINE